MATSLRSIDINRKASNPKVSEFWRLFVPILQSRVFLIYKILYSLQKKKKKTKIYFLFFFVKYLQLFLYKKNLVKK